MPRVSVIVPTYNRERTLAAALTSVLAQTYQDFEVVVADDGSTDGTAAFLESLDDRIRHVALEHSGLPARARNAGLARSSGEYVAFLDSDDEWLPHKLTQQIDALDREPSVSLVCSNAVVVNGTDPQSGGEAAEMQIDQRPTYLDLLESNFVVTSTAVVRRAGLDVVGGFSEEPILRGVEDYDLWLRLSRHAGVRFLSDALAVYRRHESSLSNPPQMSAYWRGMARVVQRATEAERGDTDTSLRDVLDQRLLNYLHALRAAQRSEQHAEHDSDDRRLRLHLGGGEVYRRGYVNIDFLPDAQADHANSVADLHADLASLSFPAGSIEEIRVQHGFEHFDRPTALRLLVDWHGWLRRAGLRPEAPYVTEPVVERTAQRWLRRAGLRPGGTLILEAVNFEQAAAAVFDPSRPREQRMRSLRHIFGSQEGPRGVHYDGWYDAKFRQTLRALGFRRIKVEESEHDGLPNILVTGRKGKDTPREDLVVAAEQLLRRALVDDSETENRLFDVWKRRLRGGTL